MSGAPAGCYTINSKRARYRLIGVSGYTFELLYPQRGLMQKVLMALAAITLSGVALAQTAAPAVPPAGPMGGSPAMQRAQRIGVPQSSAVYSAPGGLPGATPGGYQGAVPGVPAVPGAAAAGGGKADPFKPNPTTPAPAATPAGPMAPVEMAVPPEPPRTPTMGVNTDGRTFLGVIGNNKALYKTGDGYVFEQITTK